MERQDREDCVLQLEGWRVWNEYNEGTGPDGSGVETDNFRYF